jgi:hypothetical protein
LKRLATGIIDKDGKKVKRVNDSETQPVDDEEINDVNKAVHRKGFERLKKFRRQALATFCAKIIFANKGRGTEEDFNSFKHEVLVARVNTWVSVMTIFKCTISDIKSSVWMLVSWTIMASCFVIMPMLDHQCWGSGQKKPGFSENRRCRKSGMTWIELFCPPPNQPLLAKLDLASMGSSTLINGGPSA